MFKCEKLLNTMHSCIAPDKTSPNRMQHATETGAGEVTTHTSLSVALSSSGMLSCETIAVY